MDLRQPLPNLPQVWGRNNSILQEARLIKGDIGTVVVVYEDEKAYEVKFATLRGKTIAVTTLSENQVRAVHPREIAHAREI